MTPEQIIRLLGLSPHPEGGHYRETWRHDNGGERGAGTAIYYLLREGERSHWHRIDATETWHFYAGSPLELSTYREGGEPVLRVLGAGPRRRTAAAGLRRTQGMAGRATAWPMDTRRLHRLASVRLRTLRDGPGRLDADRPVGPSAVIPLRFGWGALDRYLENGNVANRSDADLEAPRALLGGRNRVWRGGSTRAKRSGSAPRRAMPSSRRRCLRSVARRELRSIGTLGVDPDAARHPSVRPPDGDHSRSLLLGPPGHQRKRRAVPRTDRRHGHATRRASGGLSKAATRGAPSDFRTGFAIGGSCKPRRPRKAVQTIAELRDVELGYELARARSELGGGRGRAARQEVEHWKRLAHRIEVAIGGVLGWAVGGRADPSVAR